MADGEAMEIPTSNRRRANDICEEQIGDAVKLRTVVT